jgi:hypothetical protein
LDKGYELYCLVDKVSTTHGPCVLTATVRIVPASFRGLNLTLVRQLGGAGLWLLVTLRRIVEATEVPEAAAEPAAVSGPEWPLPQQHGVRLSGVGFACGPFAEPVIRDLDLAVRSRRESASWSPWPGPSSLRRGWSSSTRRPATSIPTLKHRSSRRSLVVKAYGPVVRRCSSSRSILIVSKAIRR